MMLIGTGAVGWIEKAEGDWEGVQPGQSVKQAHLTAQLEMQAIQEEDSVSGKVGT